MSRLLGMVGIRQNYLAILILVNVHAHGFHIRVCFFLFFQQFLIIAHNIMVTQINNLLFFNIFHLLLNKEYKFKGKNHEPCY